MPLYAFEGHTPVVHPDAFIAPTAVLVGEVHVEAGASVWFNAVLRADYAPVIVREGANVQDNTVVHSSPGIPADIGPGSTVAHACVIHGTHIGPGTLIGNHCTTLDGAVIGAGTLVAAGSLVLGGTEIPDEVLVTGSPARIKGPIAGTKAAEWIRTNAPEYRQLAQRYAADLQPVADQPGLR